MRKIGYIIWREYISRVRTKSFLLTTFGIPLLFLAIPLISIFIAKSNTQSVNTVVLSDQSGLFADVTFADKADGSLYFKKVDATISTDSILKQIGVDGVLLIPQDFTIENVSRSPVTFISQKRVGMASREFVSETIRKAVLKMQLKKIDLSTQKIDLESEPVINFERQDTTTDKEDFIGIATAIGMIIGFMIYITITLFGTMILRGVMEEKTNRIMEVLISSVKPVQLMLGKVLGVGAVGLTQFALWGTLLGIGSIFLAPILMALGIDANTASTASTATVVDQSEIQSVLESLKTLNFSSIFVWSALYFILGFFLYGTLFAAIGAAGNDETNAQQLTLPVTLPLIISFVILQNAINDPEGKAAFWGSIIPFTSPVIMPSLLAFNPPLWQILLSLTLLIATFMAMVYFAGKIYRTGVLMYGKKITWKEMLKWLFQ
ncbi:MAG TPA: ABC transporter permease [Chitinophagales bacterium]